MPETLLKLWGFDDAPDDLRRLIPVRYAGGWVAFVCPGGAAEVVEWLVKRWNASGLPILRHEVEDGGIMLAGLHPQQASSDLPDSPEHGQPQSDSEDEGSTSSSDPPQ